MNTMKKWCMTGCFVFLCLIMGSIFLRFFTVQIFVKRMHMDNPVIQAILLDNSELKGSKVAETKTDWAKLYPFSESNERIEPLGSVGKVAKIGAKIQGTKEIVAEKISHWTSKHLMGYEEAIESYNQYKKILHWNIMARKEYNSVVEIDGGQLASFVDKEDMSEKTKNVSDLAIFCKDNGIPFIYVSAPDKIDRREKKYTALDFSNANADQFFVGLRKNGVDYLDLWDYVEKEGLATKNLFFRTDHHWLPETGLWASGIIAGYMNDRGIVESDLSLLSPDNWDKEIFEKFFLGSRGKKISLKRTTPDDITIFHPKWDTHLHMEIPEKAIIADGTFDIIYDRKFLEKVDYYHGNPYATYSWGDMPYMYIRNEDAINDKTILLIKNSIGNVIMPFLALQFKNTHAIDLRAFTGSAHELIRQKKPDVVMVMYSVGYLSRSTEINYKTHTSPGDFR